MFCPQCGQQQFSGDTRFCSRCGFQLSAVTGLLATGGIPLPTELQGQAEQHVASPRRKGMLQGGKLIFFSVFLIPLLAILQEIFNINGDFPLLGVALLMVGILRLLYALLFQEGSLRKQKMEAPHRYVASAMPYQTGMSGGSVGHAGSTLPSAHGIPARSFMPPQGITSEMAPPPSVTENTTRLLRQDEPHEPGRKNKDEG